MRNTILAAMIVFATGAAADAAAENEPLVPRKYQGVWGWEAKECRAEDWRRVETLHRITADTTQWWEASCAVTDVEETDAERNVLKVELNCSGEGEEWSSREQWKLVEIEGATYLIAAVPDKGRIQFYRRCQKP